MVVTRLNLGLFLLLKKGERRKKRRGEREGEKKEITYIFCKTELFLFMEGLYIGKQKQPESMN